MTDVLQRRNTELCSEKRMLCDDGQRSEWYPTSQKMSKIVVSTRSEEKGVQQILP